MGITHEVQQLQQNQVVSEDQDELILTVKNVSKKFCRNLKRSMAYGMMDLSKSLFGMKLQSSTLRKDEFWALDDINFALKRGEALGIIGPNGSGKTTLLRVLTGIFPPDKGEIMIKGRVGALVAIGAGFHPHMTGRENIFLNGAILGMSKQSIQENFDAMIAFADIGDFLDAPVSTYSSGMRVRLGFSIAIHSTPDILIADEILSVGDYAFRMKCHERIKAMIDRCSVILVSHHEITIRSICQKVAIFYKGKIIDFGETDEMIVKYRSMMLREHLEQQKMPVSSNSIFTPKVALGGVQIKGIELRDKYNQIVRKDLQELKKVPYAIENTVVCILDVDVTTEILNSRIFFYLRDMSKSDDLTYACGMSFSRQNEERFDKLTPGKKEIRLEMNISRLTPNIYTVYVGIADEHHHVKLYDWINERDNITFEIIASEEFKSPDALLNKPYFLPEYRWNIIDREDS